MTQTRQLRELDNQDPIAERVTPKDDAARHGKLQLTVRRLRLPVRPRGVLAE
jgi:hypothetical protein